MSLQVKTFRWGSKEQLFRGINTTRMLEQPFDDNVLLVMVEKSMLDPGDLINYQKEPVVVKDWEPFFLALRNLQFGAE